MTTQEMITEALKQFSVAHPRPSCVTQKQAGEMLGVSPQTVRRWISEGRIKLNSLGMISTAHIDELLRG